MPLTYTGRRVSPNGTTEHPSLTDLAVGQSRAARFSGQGRRWYSVLDHALFMYELAKNTASPHTLLALLLHDGHEALTGDIATPWKGAEIKAHQRNLDEKIMNAYFPGGYEEYNEWFTGEVKHFDRRALVAEARVIGPPASAQVILETFGVTDDTHLDVSVLQDRLYFGKPWFAVPPLVDGQEEHPGVKEYLKRVMNLL